MAADEQMLTPDQLAQRWVQKPSTIRTWSRNGKLRFATRIGSAWRYPLSQIEKFEKQQQVGNGK